MPPPPDNRLLRKTQKNEVFLSIKGKALDPSEFDWRTYKFVSGNYVVSELEHKDTGYYFRFNVHTRGFEAIRSPGRDRIKDNISFPLWSDFRSIFNEGIELIEKEIQAPDLWGKLLEEGKILTLEKLSAEMNTEFTPDEQLDIAERLKSLEKQVKDTTELTKENVDFLREKIEYLVEASRRQKRIDWVYMAVGVLVHIGTTIGLPPDRVQQLADYFKAFISEVVSNINKMLSN